MKTIIEQFKQMNKLPLFEIEVINNKTKAKEYIIFYIKINEELKTFETFPNQYLSKEAEQIERLKPEIIIDIDDKFTLDEHLQELYEMCIDSMLNSDYYNLPND